MDIIVVIPLRAASDCDESGAPRFYIDGQPLWEITIQHVLNAKGPREVIVAYDDDRLLEHLEKWKDLVRLWKRPETLSHAGVTTLDVLSAVSASLTEEGTHPDYLMLLEITHPLRPATIVEQLIQVVNEQPADAVFTARAVHYNMWRPDEDGLVRIHGGTDNEAIFEEMIGICSLFSPRWLATNTPFGDEIDVVPIDRFWAAIDVRDEDARWIAEQYVRRLKSGSSPK